MLIFHENIFSNTEDKVTRKQFPLILAWALTHWKAQGMTLRRVRICMRRAVAGAAGVGYVAVTRVKHPRHLMFWTDLPEHAAFQEAKYKEEFRARLRYRLRMEAKASTTLRKYGCCQADMWTTEDADIAKELLQCLDVEGKLQARAQGMEGNKDAWVWGRQEPPITALMARAVSEVGRAGESLRAQVEAVGERLLGKFHLPAVKEALGCLIPAALSPELDGK